MKKILSIFLLSTLSMFSFASEINKTQQSMQFIKNNKEQYRVLNDEINEINNNKNRIYFDIFNQKESKQIHEHIKNILSSQIKEKQQQSELNPFQQEKQLWIYQNLVSVAYIKAGFIQAAEENGVDEQKADLEFGRILTSNLKNTINNVLHEKKETSNSQKIFNYNKTGLSVNAYDIMSKLSMCNEKDLKCLKKSISDIEKIETTDLFEKLTQECISKDYSCRLDKINSVSFQNKLYYKNYLLGIVLFNEQHQ